MKKLFFHVPKLSFSPKTTYTIEPTPTFSLPFASSFLDMFSHGSGQWDGKGCTWEGEGGSPLLYYFKDKHCWNVMMGQYDEFFRPWVFNSFWSWTTLLIWSSHCLSISKHVDKKKIE